MSNYRVEMAFYVEADSESDALLAVEDGISADLARDYTHMDTEKVGD